MKKYIAFFLFSLCIFLPQTSNASTAEFFVYPLDVWQGNGTKHGEKIGDDLYHMGIDDGMLVGAGGNVIATADGIVREAQERTQFGLVILIEHTLPDNKKIVSLYGHLRPSDLRVHVGQEVHAGDVIGVIGDSSENGGWTPHLHFGIHKQPYTGEWVYYGHVRDAATADEWYDPNVFIPNHLASDSWKPTIQMNGIRDHAIVAQNADITATVTDIGSGVDTMQLKIHDRQHGWRTLAESSSLAYPYQFTVPFEEYEGRLLVRIVAKDHAGNMRRKTVPVYKKSDALTTPHIAAFTLGSKKKKIITAYQSGDKKKSFAVTDTAKNESNIGDVAFGYPYDINTPHIITLSESDTETRVHIYTPNGRLTGSFTAFTMKKGFMDSPHIAAGDVTGDGIDEIVVGSGSGKRPTVKVFTAEGKLVRKIKLFSTADTNGVDVTVGNVIGDGKNEIIAGGVTQSQSTIAIIDDSGVQQEWHPYEEGYTAGINVSSGDLKNDGDLNLNGTDEIIVSTNGDHTATVRVFNGAGEQQPIVYVPFGKGYTDPIDVGITDWENDGKKEIVISQLNAGSGRIQTYRYTRPRTLLNDYSLFSTSKPYGVRVVGWR